MLSQIPVSEQSEAAGRAGVRKAEEIEEESFGEEIMRTLTFNDLCVFG